jgi:fluoride ion exporter CrcB/FEX
VAFKKDSSGRRIMGMDLPFMVFQQAPWDESAAFNIIVLFGSLGVLMLTVLLWPIGALVRWHYARPLQTAHGGPRLLVRMVCVADVAFALAWIVMLTNLNDPAKLNDSLDPLLRIVQVVGWLGVIGTIGALWDGWLALRETNRWWWNRLHAVAIALACVGFAWFLSHWHMLHFSLKF